MPGKRAYRPDVATAERLDQLLTLAAEESELLKLAAMLRHLRGRLDAEEAPAERGRLERAMEICEASCRQLAA